MAELTTIVEAAGSAQKSHAKKQTAKKETFMTRVMSSAPAQIAIRATNGIMTVSIYFADLTSDLQATASPPPPSSPLLPLP